MNGCSITLLLHQGKPDLTFQHMEIRFIHKFYFALKQGSDRPVLPWFRLVRFKQDERSNKGGKTDIT